MDILIHVQVTLYECDEQFKFRDKKKNLVQELPRESPFANTHALICVRASYQRTTAIQDSKGGCEFEKEGVQSMSQNVASSTGLFNAVSRSPGLSFARRFRFSARGCPRHTRVEIHAMSHSS